MLVLIFLDICIFLPLPILFPVVLSGCPAVHHPSATVLSVGKEYANKLVVKNSPCHSATGPSVNLCFGPNDGGFVLCIFWSQLWACFIRMCHRRSFCNLSNSIMSITMSFGVRFRVGIITSFHNTSCVTLGKKQLPCGSVSSSVK